MGRQRAASCECCTNKSPRYGHYCYLPLYVFCGEFLLGATLHTADVAPGKRAVEELERIVSQIQARWPDVRIVVRGDSGFCNDEVMSWCEDGGIDYSTPTLRPLH